MIVYTFLLFLQDFFFRLKPKQYKKCQYSWLFKKTIWKLIKNKVNIYNQQLNFWLNIWRSHNWRSRKPQLLSTLFLLQSQKSNWEQSMISLVRAPDAKTKLRSIIGLWWASPNKAWPYKPFLPKKLKCLSSVCTDPIQIPMTYFKNHF